MVVFCSEYADRLINIVQRAIAPMARAGEDQLAGGKRPAPSDSAVDSIAVKCRTSLVKQSLVGFGSPRVAVFLKTAPSTAVIPLSKAEVFHVSLKQTVPHPL